MMAGDSSSSREHIQAETKLRPRRRRFPGFCSRIDTTVHLKFIELLKTPPKLPTFVVMNRVRSECPEHRQPLSQSQTSFCNS